MKRIFLSFVLVLSALALVPNDAEAARLGGGRSIGMQRQAVPARPASAPTQAAPAQQAAPTPAAPAPSAPAPAAPKRSWLGPLAGIAAGLGIAALLSHFGLGESVANFVMLALLAFAVIFVLKMIFGRKSAPTREPLQYAGAGAPAGATVTDLGQPAAVGTAATAGSNIPAGFDVDGFLRVAKLNFVRLQAANDARNLDDLREFVSPELYAEIKLQMDERGPAPQQTDVVTLEAELLELVTEGNRHIAGVRFSGLIREAAGAAAAPFAEVWYLVKPTDDSRGWTVAGIQQAS